VGICRPRRNRLGMQQGHCLQPSTLPTAVAVDAQLQALVVDIVSKGLHACVCK
jgi:hypothetical protein